MLKKSFKINSDIYNEKYILQAIEDFKDVSDISYVPGEVVISGDTDEDIEETFNEFMNYYLSLYNETV